MKEQDECRAYNKRRRHPPPPAPVCPPLCLTVLGHYSESISTLTKSKWRRSAVAGVADPGWVGWQRHPRGGEINGMISRLFRR